MNKTRQPMIALAALTAALAMPLAFAQTAEPTEGMQEATTEATPSEPTEAAPEASAPLTWNDVDTDKDGAISKEESTQLASLAEVFDEADADGDGLLTADEYRTYAARTDEAGADSGGGID